MEIFLIILASFLLALLFGFIKFVLSIMRGQSHLNKNHIIILITYAFSSFILGGVLYTSFGIIRVFEPLLGISNYILFIICFGFPQLILIPSFGYFFFRDSQKKEVKSSNNLQSQSPEAKS